MGKSKHFRRYQRKQPRTLPLSQIIFLDQFSVQDIRRWKNFGDKFLKFHWDYYSFLAHERSKIAEEIRKELFAAVTQNFQFSKWQRTLKYKYSLKQFSVAGSLVDPGGRFNIGDLNSSKFTPFPAFYIAAHKDTALQELLCQKIEIGKEEQAPNFALADPSSITNVSLSGFLDSIIDLRESDRLQPFLN